MLVNASRRQMAASAHLRLLGVKGIAQGVVALKGTAAGCEGLKLDHCRFAFNGTTNAGRAHCLQQAVPQVGASSGDVICRDIGLTVAQPLLLYGQQGPERLL